MAEHGALERAHVKAELIRHLAAGGQTKTQLAKRYGCTHQAVSLFATRHAAEVAQAKARLADKLDDEFAHLWAADKVNRVATLQEQVERTLDLLAVLAEPDVDGEIQGEGTEAVRRAQRANVGLAETERVIQTALRGIAEELGQLPSRTTVQHEGSVSVRYVIEGVDMDTLS